jgi:signal transduction histidine kinase
VLSADELPLRRRLRRSIERKRAEEVVAGVAAGVVSHELRAPVTVVYAALDLLADEQLSDQGRIALETGQRNADRLLRLVEDLVDLTRVQHAGMRRDAEPVPAGVLVDYAVEVAEAGAAEAGILLLGEADPHCPVHVDSDRIVQVLTNLISNAIKFSSRGAEVLLEARRQDGAVRFSVTDHGRGIPADMVDRVFESFFQVEREDRTERGGTGLGLSISQSIVDQHGGTLGVESVAGVGSRFSFALPLAPVAILRDHELLG